jgi:hypothetical protein
MQKEASETERERERGGDERRQKKKEGSVKICASRRQL